jgi:hypothetical protein
MDFSKQWHALGKEAELAGAQIALGVTALGRASHARLGDYTTAFFSLAIGLERLGKLIVVGDYAIEHSGEFPSDTLLKKFSHDLGQLMNHCEDVSGKRRSSGTHSKRPNDQVHQGIIQTLSEFATLSRYYNLNLLAGGEAANLPEPIGAWWKRVGEPILSKHYTVRQRQKDSCIAEHINTAVRAHVSVRHHSEAGDSMNDMAELLRHAGATRVVQKYGRLQVLQIVRWLTFLLTAMIYEARFDQFLGADEPFKIFLNDDRYFSRRKSWAIYP